MNNFETNSLPLKNAFSNCKTKEAVYQKMIELGSRLPSISSFQKTDSNLVEGCQSKLWLSTKMIDSKLFFEADADALISKGIAYLLVTTYQGLTPEEVLTNPPTFLEEIGIYSSLSLNRSNGLSQLYLRMKRDALYILTNQA